MQNKKFYIRKHTDFNLEKQFGFHRNCANRHYFRHASRTFISRFQGKQSNSDRSRSYAVKDGDNCKRLLFQVANIQRNRNQKKRINKDAPDRILRFVVKRVLVIYRRLSIHIKIYQYISPPIPPPAGAAGAGSLMSVTRLSVVSNVLATDAAFCNALLVTFVGSRMPAFTISQYTSF